MKGIAPQQQQFFTSSSYPGTWGPSTGEPYFNPSKTSSGNSCGLPSELPPAPAPSCGASRQHILDALT
eukprot:90816-Hanusia_phi.AAC.1